MSATDLGLGGGLDGLARLLAWRAGTHEAPRILARPAVRVASADAPVRHGFFFGAIGIARAVALAQRSLHRRGIVAGTAAALTLAAFTVDALMGRRRGLLAPAPLAIAIDDGDARTDDYLFVLATTLGRLELGARPFWGAGADAGPLRYSGVRAPAPKLVRAIVPMMYGWPTRRMPSAHYESGRIGALTLAFDGPYTLDGEIYQAARAHALRLATSAPLSFVCWARRSGAH